MKKITLVLMAVVVSCMFLTGCGNDIDAVKGGTLGNYKSLTIGDAFDNYSHFKSSSWQSFETKNKQRVVQFNGELEITPLAKSRDMTKMVIAVQFLINKDDTFKLACVQLQYLKKGKEKTELINSLADDIISNIYNNKPINLDLFLRIYHYL